MSLVPKSREFVLDHVPALPIEQLEQLIPRLVDGITFVYANGYLTASRSGESQPARLFPSNSEELRIFNLFDGVRSIEDVSRLISSGDEQDDELLAAMLRVKRLFAHLVRLGICVPSNPLPPLPPGDESIE